MPNDQRSERHIPGSHQIGGYIVGLAGLAYLAQGYGYGTGYTSVPEYPVLISASYQVVMVVWAIWLLVSAWQRKESVQAALA